MQRFMDKYLKADEGLSIAEVVVAAAVLFFAGAAMLSLIVATQQQALVAKEKANLVNAVSGYMESVRANPAGSFSDQTTVVGAYTIVIHPTVRSVDETDAGGSGAYRLVTLTGVASMGSAAANVMTFTAESIVSTFGAK